VTDLEIYQAVGRYVIGETDAGVARSYASTALGWTLACYLLLTIVVLALADPIRSTLLGSHAEASLVRIALVWTVAQGVLNLTQAQLRWNMRPWLYATAGALNAVASAGAALAFVFLAHLGVAGVLWGYASGSLAALLLVTALTRRMFSLRFDTRQLRQLLRYSAPLVIADAGVFLNLFADRLVIKHFRSVADVGIYAVGNRVAMIIALVLTGFVGASMPLFLSQYEDPAAPGQIARIFRLFAAFAFVMFLLLSLFATPLVRILAAREYQSAAGVVPLLVISTLFANMYMFAPGLAIAKRTPTMAAVALSAGVANLGLAIALVPPLGIIGAGIATAISSIAWFAALMVFSQQHYPVPHHWVRLAAATGVAGGLVGVCFATLPLGPSDALGAGTLAVRTGLFLIGGSLCAWLCLDRTDIHSLRAMLSGVRAAQPGERQLA
jgi:O-antigen/teichoic acid export membrane protein